MPQGREQGRSVSSGLVEIPADAAMPVGPYAVGLTLGPNGASPPYTVICGTGQAIAGHVASKACAQAIADALNRAAFLGAKP